MRIADERCEVRPGTIDAPDLTVRMPATLLPRRAPRRGEPRARGPHGPHPARRPAAALSRSSAGSSPRRPVALFSIGSRSACGSGARRRRQQGGSVMTTQIRELSVGRFAASRRATGRWCSCCTASPTMRARSATSCRRSPRRASAPWRRSCAATRRASRPPTDATTSPRWRGRRRAARRARRAATPCVFGHDWGAVGGVLRARSCAAPARRRLATAAVPHGAGVHARARERLRAAAALLVHGLLPARRSRTGASRERLRVPRAPVARLVAGLHAARRRRWRR